MDRFVPMPGRTEAGNRKSAAVGRVLTRRSIATVLGGGSRPALRQGAKRRLFARTSRGDGITVNAPGGFRQRGFTLLEVIIAFALLALALTLLLGTLSGSTREVRWSADTGRAALHAQSLLDQAGVGEVLQPGTRDGEFEDGRYRWTMRVEPYVDPLQRAATTIEPGVPRLLRLALTVEWGDGDPRQRLEVQTLRLAQPEAMP